MVGRNGLTRAVLVRAFEDAGGADVASVLATGNIVFTAGDAESVAAAAADLLRASTGLSEPIFVRSFADLQRIYVADPFAAAPTDNVYEQCVSFAAGELFGVGPLPIESGRRDVCIFRVAGREAYSVTRLIAGRCGTAGPVVERRAGQPVTTRNWRTIRRLIEKHAEPGAAADPPKATGR